MDDTVVVVGTSVVGSATDDVGAVLVVETVSVVGRLPVPGTGSVSAVQ